MSSIHVCLFTNKIETKINVIVFNESKKVRFDHLQQFRTSKQCSEVMAVTTQILLNKIFHSLNFFKIKYFFNLQFFVIQKINYIYYAGQ